MDTFRAMLSLESSRDPELSTYERKEQKFKQQQLEKTLKLVFYDEL